jgi:tRNA threonylcarbamoyladenosine biosynthesis protein TsaE
MKLADGRLPGDSWEVTSDSERDTVALGRAAGEAISPGDVVLLCGELGAGKTRFVQGIAEGIGSSRYARSPSFVLVSRHRGRITFHHCDLYRLGGPQDVDELGLMELVDGGDALAVEWADRARAAFPADALELLITVSGEERRVLTFTAPGPKARRLLGEVRARVARSIARA